MKILFICSEFFDYVGNHARAFYEAMVDFAGKDNVRPFLFPRRGLTKEEEYSKYIVDESYTTINKIKNTIFRGDPKVGQNVVTELKRILKEEHYDIVFVQRSTLGCLLKIIRNSSTCKIVSYNPDVYIDYMKGKWKGNKLEFIKNSLVYIKWLKFDKIMALESDANVVLNERDKKGFIKYYKRVPDLVLPLFCIDKFDPNNVSNNNTDKFILLFVGSLFWPNIEGIEWFIENVIPYVPECVELKIVGSKMETLLSKSQFQQDKVTLIGSVEKTEPYYYEADLIVAPIFSGTGMKNKTAEALMYGKEFLAAPEALVGYTNLDRHCCYNAQDFINKINYYVKNRPKKFNKSLRDIFLNEYSIKAVSGRLEELFKRVSEEAGK